MDLLEYCVNVTQTVRDISPLMAMHQDPLLVWTIYRNPFLWWSPLLNLLSLDSSWFGGLVALSSLKSPSPSQRALLSARPSNPNGLSHAPLAWSRLHQQTHHGNHRDCKSGRHILWHCTSSLWRWWHGINLDWDYTWAFKSPSCVILTIAQSPYSCTTWCSSTCFLAINCG